MLATVTSQGAGDLSLGQRKASGFLVQNYVQNTTKMALKDICWPPKTVLHTICMIYSGVIPCAFELCALSKPLELLVNIYCCLFILANARKSYRGQT